MARSVLGPEYRKLWTASTISNLGVTLVAGPLLAASLTRDPALVAGLTFAERLPWLLFSLPSGALGDRLDRRLLMGTVDVLRAGIIGVLGLAVLGGWASLPLMYAVFFLLGTAETLFANASLAILPSAALVLALRGRFRVQRLENFRLEPAWLARSSRGSGG